MSPPQKRISQRLKVSSLLNTAMTHLEQAEQLEKDEAEELVKIICIRRGRGCGECSICDHEAAV